MSSPGWKFALAGFAAGVVVAARHLSSRVATVSSSGAARSASSSSQRTASDSLVRRGGSSGVGETTGAFVVGIGGASGSGKSSLCSRVRARLIDAGVPAHLIAMMSFDAYYHGLQGRDPSEVNFDDPTALDTELLATHLACLRRGETIEEPHYDFTTHCRLPTTTRIEGAKIVILDGIFTLTVADVRNQCDLTAFTIEDLDTCLIRRLRRDLVERGRDVASVLDQYERYVKPGYHTFIAPSMVEADVVVPRARDNHAAQNSICSTILQHVDISVFAAPK